MIKTKQVSKLSHNLTNQARSLLHGTHITCQYEKIGGWWPINGILVAMNIPKAQKFQKNPRPVESKKMFKNSKIQMTIHTDCNSNLLPQ